MVTTNTGSEPDEPQASRKERVADAVRSTGTSIRKASGASQELPLRVLVLFAVIAVALSVSPLPWAGLGLIALILLALDTGVSKRGGGGGNR